MSEEKQLVETEQEVKGKLVLSFTKPTPVWATWIFRVVFIFGVAISYWVSATRLIPDASKVEIMAGLNTVSLIVWGIGRGLGIDKKQFEGN